MIDTLPTRTDTGRTSGPAAGTSDRLVAAVSKLGCVIRQAFADESFHEAATDGFYVLAAAVVELDAHETVREAMRELRGKRDTRKLHWNEMDRAQQRAAAKTVAGLDGFHVVTIGAPVPAKRQEHARAACLTRLVHELHSFEVTELFMESRPKALNARDIATVTGARYGLPKGTVFRVEHMPGMNEALFWVADIVAGAVRAHREGIDEHRAVVQACLHEINVVTDC